MLNAKICGIGPLVREKELLKVLTIYGRGGNLRHVASIMLINFHIYVP